MAEVQESLNSLQTYPSGVITGTLMWDTKEYTFCVLVETVRAHWSLVEKLIRHTECNNERMAGELQLPFYYEADQRWHYQPLKYIQEVDIADLRERLQERYAEVSSGRRAAPLLLLSDLTCKANKVCPVTDGEGGPGEVFTCNAAAQEYLHLGEERVMLSACKTEENALEALDMYGIRRPPPPAPVHKTTRRGEAGPSGHAALPTYQRPYD
ncbi:hypothetical protein CYMTET_3071 [Cymbomonas tetramitiformis]|uniref:Uncharacterized protein n=1 Tax=Cymbomonas tetramitiformis TaxID=36881 RepID=A0AAE0H5T2_9CHLO|nr:hypothetical protein CYMTET_39104 [Cymbomonas tetramitiformis]KAK3289506.1 hypothetical protein CYMTET_3071 [Cymbomonas tetramitiformis]